MTKPDAGCFQVLSSVTPGRHEKFNLPLQFTSTPAPSPEGEWRTAKSNRD